MGKGGMIRLFAYKCPYFVSDRTEVHGKTFSIRCEGGSCVLLPDRKTACQYAATYCASYDWRQCSIAKSLNDKYAREEKKNER